VALSNQQIAELFDLLWRVRSETATSEEIARLERLVRENQSAREFYVRYFHLCAGLYWYAAAREKDSSALQSEQTASSVSLPVDEASLRAEVPFSTGVTLEFGRSPAKPLPKIKLDAVPPKPVPWYSIHSPIGLHLVAHTISAILLLIGLGIASVVYVSHDYEIAAGQAATSEEDSGGGGDGLSGALATAEKIKPKKEEMPVVGHISGMVDCRWADPALKPIVPRIRQGTKFALVSGLMEITYDTGAKVILQGPCTYEVESPHGGYLAFGKLTAKVASSRQPVASAKSQANHKSEIRNHKSPISKSPNLQISKFAVRTPTALITDLGTEFGVEVTESGESQAYVFQGRIEVRLTGDVSGNESRVVVLGADQSARVEQSSKEGKPRVIRLDASETATYSAKFARRLREPPKFLDLLDIVAGGDGLGNRRERGIDPTTGMEDPVFVHADRGGNKQYHLVSWHPLIDGVFVPDGRNKITQLDSSRHFFDGFPDTCGRVYGSIWARAAAVKRPDLSSLRGNRWVWVYALADAQRFMPHNRGFLSLCPNVGVTFDLQAIRKQYSDNTLAFFRSSVGLGDAKLVIGSNDGLADVWIFVDGQLKLRRTRLSPQDGVIDVSVELKPNNKFLTLVTTDGGNGYQSDWVIFGEPVLELSF